MNTNLRFNELEEYDLFQVNPKRISCASSVKDDAFLKIDGTKGKLASSQDQMYCPDANKTLDIQRISPSAHQISDSKLDPARKPSSIDVLSHSDPKSSTKPTLDKFDADTHTKTPQKHPVNKTNVINATTPPCSPTNNMDIHQLPPNPNNRFKNDAATPPIPNVSSSKTDKGPKDNPMARFLSLYERHHASLESIPKAPEYHPTEEEWRNPGDYIRKIQPEASKYGICIIIPPFQAAIPATANLKHFKLSTRLQTVRNVSCGSDWNTNNTFYERGKIYSVHDFQSRADALAKKRFGTSSGIPSSIIEASYWDERESNSRNLLTVEYGNDVEGTGFCENDPGLGQSMWNLNKLPTLEGSALRWCYHPIPGISAPMLYFGMLYSTFAWHVEDHFLYSINYQHIGAPKIWYGVPATDADAFERAASETVFRRPCNEMRKDGCSFGQIIQQVQRALMNKTTMLSPKALGKHNVKVYKAIQDMGSYVVTFPRAYHAGFSCGYNIGEAVNFSTPDWWPFGEDSRNLYSSMKYRQIIAHEQLLCDDVLHAAYTIKSIEHCHGSDTDHHDCQGGAHPSNTSMKFSSTCVDVSMSALNTDGVVSPIVMATPFTHHHSENNSNKNNSNKFKENMKSEMSDFNALFAVFVSFMRRQNQQRKTLQLNGTATVQICPDTSDQLANTSIECSECKHLCYLSSVVVDAMEDSSLWKHVCLHCALLRDPGACINAVLFVKPIWDQMESLAKNLEGRFFGASTSTLSAMHPLDGITHPLDPNPHQPYQWYTSLSKPSTEFPSWIGSRGQSSQTEPFLNPLTSGHDIYAMNVTMNAIGMTNVFARRGGNFLPGDAWRDATQNSTPLLTTTTTTATTTAATTTIPIATTSLNALHAMSPPKIPIKNTILKKRKRSQSIYNSHQYYDYDIENEFITIDNSAIHTTTNATIDNNSLHINDNAKNTVFGMTFPTRKRRLSSLHHQQQEYNSSGDKGTIIWIPAVDTVPSTDVVLVSKGDIVVQSDNVTRLLDETFPRTVIQVQGHPMLLGSELVHISKQPTKNGGVKRILCQLLRDGGVSPIKESDILIADCSCILKHERNNTNQAMIRKEDAQVMLRGLHKKESWLFEYMKCFFSGVWGSGELEFSMPVGIPANQIPLEKKVLRKKLKFMPGKINNPLLFEDVSVQERLLNAIQGYTLLSSVESFNTFETALHEAPGSTEKCRLYYYHNNNTNTLQHQQQYKEEYKQQELVISGTHFITKALLSSGKSGICQVPRWIQAVASSPHCTVHHLNALCVIKVYLHKWVRPKMASFIFTIEQCAIIAELGYKLKDAVAYRGMMSVMEAVWGEERVHDSIKKVYASQHHHGGVSITRDATITNAITTTTVEDGDEALGVVKMLMNDIMARVCEAQSISMINDDVDNAAGY